MECQYNFFKQILSRYSHSYIENNMRMGSGRKKQGSKKIPEALQPAWQDKYGKLVTAPYRIKGE
jgi:hypothetical protein